MFARRFFRWIRSRETTVGKRAGATAERAQNFRGTFPDTATKAEAPEESPERRMIRPPRLMAPSGRSGSESAAIRITAVPTRDGKECLFMVSRPLLEGHSWWFYADAPEGHSSLAGQLFAHDEVDRVLLYRSNLTIVLKKDRQVIWPEFARSVGATIRAELEANSPLLAEDIIATLPGEDKVREQVQNLIDTQVNPGVADHNGSCTLEKVDGNTVFISMGGGCQGCSLAGDTLKYGIEKTFRDHIEGLGAVFDETEHEAGQNPFFTQTEAAPHGEAQSL